VPIGVFRTWVKYVEKGAFPYTSRHFSVMRCNHCDAAPCIEICPTRALYRRPDGIVDFDSARCIGCKSCMQACPYDAVYMDPDTNTAAKCNFCAHRVEADLSPACVIVCPTQAIIAGDLDDIGSHVSRIIASEKTSVRKPQKGTQPKLFYVGVEGDLLQPTRLSHQNSYVWADRRYPPGGGIEFASEPTREVYDVEHPVPWGWKIPAYLWTKSIAAGTLLVAALLLERSHNAGKFITVTCPVISLVALLATTLLLIFDLKRPERFLFLLTKSNFRSWLVLGAYILMCNGGLAATWLLVGLFAERVPRPLAWCTGMFAIGSACYSAFLFAQAKGRDLWQSPLFLWHLLVQALIAGSSSTLLAGIVSGASLEMIRQSSIILAVALTVSLGMVLGEVVLPHVSEDVSLAMRFLIGGRYRWQFWGLTIGGGLAVPMALAVLFLFSMLPLSVLVVAALLALLGLYWFEDLWVKAGQAVALS